MTWDDKWGSVHEAAHAVVALHFGLTVERATMTNVIIPHHRGYTRPGDFFERLIVSESGDAATTLFLDYSDDASNRRHHELSMYRLTCLGADQQMAECLIEAAKCRALKLVPRLKPEILTLAQALRAHRTLSGDEIERALTATPA